MTPSPDETDVIHGDVADDFLPLARQFGRLFGRPRQAGGALSVCVDGEPVVDIWAGYADVRRRRLWTRDTAALCFSATKGVLATVLHRLVDRGLLDYEDPVAAFWPDFAQQDKEGLTVRHLLGHMAGLHRVRGLVSEPFEVCDHAHMATLLAAAAPRPSPGAKPGYHAFTFGWLVAKLIEEVSGRDVRAALRDEVVSPLGLDAMWFGAPAESRFRVAGPHPRPSLSDGVLDWVGRRIDGFSPTRGFAEAFLAPGFGPLMFADERLHDTLMPAVNGVVTARALCRMYAALACGGRVGGTRFLSDDLVREVGRVQSPDRDYVLGARMRWRLGYHQGFVYRGGAPRAFGHFGFGGSGAWADPDSGVAIAFVTNRVGATTPVGDARLLRLGATALRLARSTSVRPA